MARLARAYPPKLRYPNFTPYVSYNATGAGADKNNQVTATTAISWSHTAAAGTYVVVGVGMGFGAGTNVQPTPSATYGGVAMTLLGTQPIFNNGTFGIASLFGLANVPGGAQTVAASGTVASGTLPNVAGNSVSYFNVLSAGTTTTGFGNGASLSVPATGIKNGLVVNALAMNTVAAATINSYNKTQRSANTVTTADVLTLIGDSATVGAFNFTATQSTGNNTWGGIAAVLSPILLVPPHC